MSGKTQRKTVSDAAARDTAEPAPRAAGATTGEMLGGYPGLALLLAADASVIASNDKGVALEALLKHKAVPEVVELIDKAAASGSIAAGVVTIKSSRGGIVLEVTVAPFATGEDGDRIYLVLGRDLTMERNLRTTLVDSRQRYKDLVEINSDFAWEVGPEGTFVFVSPKGALGFKAQELVGRKAEDMVIQPEVDAPVPFLSRRPLEDVEMWMRRADGKTACIIVSCRPLYDAEERWQGSRGVCRDVTDERDAESALGRARHREQLLNYIIRTIRDELEPHNMLDVAAAATARAIEAVGCRIFRLTDRGFMVAAEYGNARGLDPLEGMLGDIKGDIDVLAIDIADWHVLATATHYRTSINGAISIWRGEDRGPWEEDQHLLICDVANQLGIANEQIAAHERIVRLSRTDGMTGLLNRRAFFEEELPRRVDRLERNRQTAALFYVDMDNFKRVNDVHGHQAGDDAILFLRDMLMEYSRPGDVIARLGGDEFAMWLDGIGPETTVTRAGVLLEASTALQKKSRATRITPSASPSGSPCSIPRPARTSRICLPAPTPPCMR